MELEPVWGKYVPGGQLLHCSTMVAPSNVENFPIGHGVHDVELIAPRDPEYEPAAHNTHVLILVEPVAFE